MEKRNVLKAVNNHSRACILYDPSHFVLQQLDYIQYIDFYHERIAFHVKDAELILQNKELWWIPKLVKQSRTLSFTW
jgi:sugar phosphate isomerase/epimerase